MTTLYLTEYGTTVRCENETIIIKKQHQAQAYRLIELNLIIILPGVQLTSVVIAELLDRGIETIFLRKDGQFRGRLQGQFHTNPTIRLAQYQVVNTVFGLAIAQKIVEGKIRNQRTLLQRRNRNAKGKIGELSEAIDLIASYLIQFKADSTFDRDFLMGLEGICARTYFQALQHWFPDTWRFAGRNRRPPLDPINALLSWGYGVLLARVFSIVVQAGLDPYLGFFHSNQPYRPNLALDLMEEFRPIIVDQAVINIIQSNLLEIDDFEASPDGIGTWLGSTAKKLFITELEQQFIKAVNYPPQNRQLKLHQIILEQARSLGRCFVERNLNYEPFLLK